MAWWLDPTIPITQAEYNRYKSRLDKYVNYTCSLKLAKEERTGRRWPPQACVTPPA